MCQCSGHPAEDDRHPGTVLALSGTPAGQCKVIIINIINIICVFFNNITYVIITTNIILIITCIIIGIIVLITNIIFNIITVININIIIIIIIHRLSHFESWGRERVGEESRRAAVAGEVREGEAAEALSLEGLSVQQRQQQR